MKFKNIFPLAASIIACELAGVVGSVFSISAVPTWYASLLKPALNPPSWIFGPVWTTLYFLMGIAAFLVWQKRSKHVDTKKALVIFGVQLGLNTLWSIIFFGFHSPGLALITLVAMWLMICSTMVVFYNISKTATYLLIPYIFWVSFSCYLNFALWRLN